MRVLSCVLALQLATQAAAAESSIVPIEVDQALEKACDKETTPSPQDAAKKLDDAALSQTRILAELAGIYKVTFSEAEMQRTVISNVLNRVQSCTDWATPLKRCARPEEVKPDTPILENHKAPDLQLRNALIRLVAFAESESSKSYGRILWSGTVKNTPASKDDDKLLAMRSGEASLSVVCTHNDRPPTAVTTNNGGPTDVMDALDVLLVSGATAFDTFPPFGIPPEAPGGTTMSPYELMQQFERKPFEPRILIAKDPTQFFPKVGSPAEIGWSLEGANTTNLEIDAAIGASIRRDDRQLEKRICGDSLCLPGNRRAYTLYAGYSQEPTEETVFADDDELKLEDGRRQRVTREFAYGTFTLGARVDYEYVGGVDPETLKRRIGSKTSFSVERLVDNFEEFEANKIAATWHPPSWFHIDRGGYRQEWQPDWFGQRASFKWDFNSVIDYIEYLGAPLDLDSPRQDDRQEISDYTRLGFDVSMESSMAFPFTLDKTANRLSLKYEHEYRRPLNGSDTDAGLNTYSVSIKNFLDTIASLSVQYEEGVHPDSLVDRNNWSVKAQFKTKFDS